MKKNEQNMADETTQKAFASRGLTCRSFMAGVASAAMALTLFVGCGGAPAATNEGSAAGSAAATSKDTSAVATGKLIVGFDQSYPPYGYVGDDGEYTGFDLDLARAVAEEQGWELELEAIDWDAKDAMLKSGAINCIWNGFTMDNREDDYTFSDPYMLNAQVVVVRADSGIEDAEGLAGKTVVTQVDSAAEAVLKEDAADLAATFASLETIGDYNTAFMQLESGAVDAVACDLSIAMYQMTAKPDAYVMLDDYLSEENYAVGFKKGDTATAKKVTETLKALYEDGTVDEIAAKYADQGLTMDNWQIK
ncbi:transporter substrate-binding domain-containing protein [Collinsella stercoris]|uniref:Gram-positive signal peptide protein, YSIRK family n=1 Tax=Collinsella stercoris DSM 13279 TaxID=445975 RepID=B6G7R6_9ACTN|nr:transporter substrate-binding domain-containing protein [Collinsella stercoris]EEA91685.1 Gram-positive signal peptide protein, YSIRK family [Collinsella stercoris DSM 13279]UEA44953.1 transporter substrate-binding domain-containing protein [Collinsella stercoris DSM 13279]UWP12524.1 transporter substrate-binding domain-containing protein [Collinsella stercoris]